MGEFIEVLNAGKQAMLEGRYSKAISYLRSAKLLNNRNVYVCRLLGNCYRALGHIQSAVDAYNEGLSRCYHSGTHSRLLNALNYCDLPQEVIAEEHKNWGRRFVPDCLPAAGISRLNNLQSEKIRVGYVLADFCAHPVAYFLLPIYRAHDKNRFNIITINNGEHLDDVTKDFKALSDGWHDVAGMSTRQLQQIISQEKIDILVDLAGHTSGNRLDIFACKAAPLQITYLGYPNTTGLTTIDYRVVDSHSDPFDVPEAWHTEKLHRMPSCFLCFEPPREKLGLTLIPRQRNGYVTFGSFNKIGKIGEKIISVWKRILDQMPSAKMMFKSDSFSDSNEAAQFLRRFSDAGLKDSSRLALHQLTPSRSQHMLMYNEMDIALDTYPYNGTTTTFQALYMGVPVITLQGRSHISRVSSSILINLGLNELVATNEDEYIKKVLDLACNPDKIQYYKSTIREKLLQSVLTNSRLFVKELESFYQDSVKKNE